MLFPKSEHLFDLRTGRWFTPPAGPQVVAEVEPTEAVGAEEQNGSHE